MGHYCTGPDDLSLPDSVDFSAIEIVVALKLRSIIDKKKVSPKQAIRILNREMKLALREPPPRDYKAESRAFNEGFESRVHKIDRTSNPYNGVPYMGPSWDFGWSVSNSTERVM